MVGPLDKVVVGGPLGAVMVVGHMGQVALVMEQHRLLFQRASTYLASAVVGWLHESNVCQKYRCTCVCSTTATVIYNSIISVLFCNINPVLPVALDCPN